MAELKLTGIALKWPKMLNEDRKFRQGVKVYKEF